MPGQTQSPVRGKGRGTLFIDAKRAERLTCIGR